MYERGEREDLLDPKTRPTTLSEGDKVSIKILASRFGFEPAFWAEYVRVGEDGGVVVEGVGGCADCGTSGYHPILVREWLHGLTWEATCEAAFIAEGFLDEGCLFPALEVLHTNV
jgi:hypothetical protein